DRLLVVGCPRRRPVFTHRAAPLSVRHVTRIARIAPYGTDSEDTSSLCRSCPGYRPRVARSRVPPWRRVADDLRRRIEAGGVPPGGPLPSLLALVDEYGGSPSTAGKAVAGPRDEGVLGGVAR